MLAGQGGPEGGGACCAAGPQFLSLHSLLDELSAFSARRPNAHLRPRTRPQGAAAARRWWRYAITVAAKQSRSQFLPWSQLLKVGDC